MKIQFDKDLDVLKQMLIDMYNKVNKMIELANKILFQNDISCIEEMYKLESDVNYMEVDIDNHCVALMARHQPTAIDLRFILSVSKMSNHLERIADLGLNIVKSIKYISQNVLEQYVGNIQLISTISLQMVEDAMSAFIEHDAEKARAVCVRDDEVDNLHKNNFRKFLDEILKSKIDPESGIDMVFISKHFERIADQATNLAEEVIFYVQGKNIKHHLEGKVELH